MNQLLLVFFLSSAFGHPKMQPRIFKGEDAAEGQFPYHVSIRFSGLPGCGGSIIGPNTVLTSALYLIQTTNDTKLINVVAGSHKLSGGTTYNVTKLYFHPKFDPYTSLKYDLAIVKVTPPFIYNNSIQPIKLASTSIGDNQDAIATGFGTTHTRFPSEILQFIRVKTVNLKDCKEKWGKPADFALNNASICTVASGRRGGSCPSDFGGALVNEDMEQVGVISYNYCPSFEFPDIYTNVVSHKEWIEEQIKL